MHPVTQADIDSITKLEQAFGTVRFLPQEEDIPAVFKESLYGGTIYNRVIDAWFVGGAIPDGEITFNLEFRHDGVAIQKFILAHLKSFEPKHEHKIAGCAYLLSQILTIKEVV